MPVISGSALTLERGELLCSNTHSVATQPAAN